MIIRDYIKGDEAMMPNFAITPDEMARIMVHGEGRTLITEAGEPLMTMGVTIINEGVGAVWSSSTPLASQHARAVVRATRNLIDSAIKKYNLHRVETVVRADNPQLMKWIKLVGFTGESVKHMGCSDKTDLVVFVKLRGH